jgi:ubiquinone/menaquinone biosynthesis C-methylase UbiE
MADRAFTPTPDPVAREFYNRQQWWSHSAVKLFRRYTPFWWRRALRTPYFLALDGVDFLLGRRDPLVPPRYLDFAGHMLFAEAGQENLRHLKELCGLQPSHRILDIGCGIGRMAVPFTNYLTTGSYEGMDVVPSGIRWCQKNITAKYPRLRFQVADIFNKMYNPRGRFECAQYRFPFPDGEFDVVFLVSVFTHLLPRDMEHYVSEISRVLKPGGKLMFTCFLLNDEARKGRAAGKSEFDFDYELPGCRTTDPDTPETAIAFEESSIAPLLRRYSLLADPTYLGGWCGRTNYLSYGDVVTATRAKASEVALPEVSKIA